MSTQEPFLPKEVIEAQRGQINSAVWNAQFAAERLGMSEWDVEDGQRKIERAIEILSDVSNHVQEATINKNLDVPEEVLDQRVAYPHTPDPFLISHKDGSPDEVRVTLELDILVRMIQLASNFVDRPGCDLPQATEAEQAHMDGLIMYLEQSLNRQLV